jgi:hypothetical protein
MSPEMLTLVAAVLAYERPASEAAERSSGLVGLRYAMSDTSDENDMTAMWLWCGSLVERRRE